MSRADSPLRGRMIFNVGARRSGTFWLQRIVTAHPAVSAVPSETHLISHGIAPLFDRFQHSDRDSGTVGFVYVDRERLLDATRDLCDVVFGEFLEQGAERVAERTPLHVQHLRLIGEIYPDARFIHIIRDGRDVARSIAAQSWGGGTVARAAEEWRVSVSAARTAGLPDRSYHELRYEELFADPEPIVASVFDFLELPATPEVMELALAEASREQNVDASRPGVGTEKWRTEFTPDELEAFNLVAGRLLAELGYRWAEPDEAKG